MRLFRRFIVAVGMLLMIFIAVGFFLPATAHVERSISIARPVPETFAFLNGYRHFNEWSPWANIDPKTQYVFSGPTSGVGARMAWSSSDANVGVGSQEILAVKDNTWIQMKLDFGSQGQALASYILTADGAQTRVTWGFDMQFGKNLLGRYCGLLMNKMIGADYEKGLANLKQVIEKPATKS